MGEGNAWKRSHGRNVGELGTWAPLGRKPKIHGFEGAMRKILLSDSEGDGLNG